MVDVLQDTSESLLHAQEEMLKEFEPDKASSTSKDEMICYGMVLFLCPALDVLSERF
jgi:SWI/SNF-related matrix-associated actin-dependent regulator of chromatin subfamily A3